MTAYFGPGWVRGVEYLTVNVGTPRTAQPGLPVMVFVHGGGFVAGSDRSSLYDGSRFAHDGVVLVTVNYRLGTGGFLDLPGAPANRGLLNVLEALRWVQQNIGEFGGDPANVTLFGQSAGATITRAILADPTAEGLVRRAFADGHGASVDLLIGTNTDEGHLCLVPFGTLDTSTVADAEAAAPLFRSDPTEYSEAFRRRRPAGTTGELRSAIVSEALFVAGSRSLADAHASHPGSGTFRYEFAWRSPALKGQPGAAQAAESLFVFDVTDQPALRGPDAFLGTCAPAGRARCPDACCLDRLRHRREPRLDALRGPPGSSHAHRTGVDRHHGSATRLRPCPGPSRRVEQVEQAPAPMPGDRRCRRPDAEPAGSTAALPHLRLQLTGRPPIVRVTQVSKQWCSRKGRSTVEGEERKEGAVRLWR